MEKPQVQLYSGTIDPIAFYNKCHDEKGRFCDDETPESGGGYPKNRAKLRPVDREGQNIARKYHKATTDKQGKDYTTGHLTQVGTSLPPELAMAGWLHDTLEDTDATPESLRKDGVSPEIIRIVKAVTTDGPNSSGKGELPYPERMQAVISEGGPKAARVKLSDLNSNSDPSRNSEPLTERQQKYQDKIALAKTQMETYLKDADPPLYQDYLDRVKNRPGAFDWSQVEDGPEEEKAKWYSD